MNPKQHDNHPRQNPNTKWRVDKQKSLILHSVFCGKENWPKGDSLFAHSYCQKLLVTISREPSGTMVGVSTFEKTTRTCFSWGTTRLTSSSAKMAIVWVTGQVDYFDDTCSKPFVWRLAYLWFITSIAPTTNWWATIFQSKRSCVSAHFRSSGSNSLQAWLPWVIAVSFSFGHDKHTCSKQATRGLLFSLVKN